MLIVIAYIGCERTVSTVLLILSIVISGAIFVGHLTNQNDLAPNYAGILMGITNTPGTISAFVLPALVGALTEGGVRILFIYLFKYYHLFIFNYSLSSIHSKDGVIYFG